MGSLKERPSRLRREQPRKAVAVSFSHISTCPTPHRGLAQYVLHEGTAGGCHSGIWDRAKASSDGPSRTLGTNRLVFTDGDTSHTWWL